MENSSAFIEFRDQLLIELTGNILPFWMAHAQDKRFGGFYGAVRNNLEVDNEVPRFSILCARILWAFSAVYRKLNDEEYLQVAHRAYEYLIDVLWDEKFGGVYWSVDKYGDPISNRKHQYAQAFAIYGLSEYYQATQDSRSLTYAQNLFQLVEEYAYDSAYGGYIEGSSREWQSLDDMRLSEKDMNCRKSMNTMLHLIEAFTNLYHIWAKDLLGERIKDLLMVFQSKIFDTDLGHLKLFFDNRWNSLSTQLSFGHDIEASWLMCEAADLTDDPQSKEKTQKIALILVESVLKNGMHRTGNLILEGNASGSLEEESIWWWPQVEGMVGFINAYQITGKKKYVDVALRIWEFIQGNFIDQERGGWYKQISLDGVPIVDSYKIGPWEGPYHHIRACLEIMDRLSGH